MQKQMKIADIKIGKRFRKDMGDLEGLAADIKEQGLIVPLGVSPDNTLVCGERRLRALKLNGTKTVDVFVIKNAKDQLAIQRMEEAENNLAKPFTYSEKVAIREDIVKLEDRRGKKAPARGLLTEAERNAKKERIAKQAGFRSRREFERVQEVIKSGDKELIELMDISQDDRDAGLTPSEAVAVLQHPAKVRREIIQDDSPRKGLKGARDRARRDNEACSDMTHRVWRAMAPINWIVDGYAPDEGYMDGAFKSFATKPPMNNRVNKAALPGLLEAVRTVREAYQQFERELKEVIK